MQGLIGCGLNQAAILRYDNATLTDICDMPELNNDFFNSTRKVSIILSRLVHKELKKL